MLLPLSWALCASLKQPCVRTHPQDEYAEELLGEDHYATQFFNALNSDETEAAIEEVGVAVGEAKQEHDLLGAFASGCEDFGPFRHHYPHDQASLSKA